MTELEKRLYDQILADHAYVVSLRRELHQHPELSREEFETAGRIERELDKLGIAHRRVAVTGVYAEITGTGPCEGAPRCIVLRADIDALPIQQENDVPYKSLCPGKMHACGHDAHTAGSREKRSATARGPLSTGETSTRPDAPSGSMWLPTCPSARWC